MVRMNSLKVKFPVILVLIGFMAYAAAALPPSDERALSIIGLILLAEAYFLGIDSSIINRIIKMKPLSRVINGLYYVILGVMTLGAIALSQSAFYQWGFGIFVCIVGVSILIYQAKKGPKVVFVKGDQVKPVAMLKSETKETKKGSDAKPAAPQAKGFKATVRKYEFYTYFISLGSDLAVTAVFLAIFALMEFVTAFLLFLLGYLIRFLGDQIAKRAGVVKELALPEEVPWR